MSEINRENVKGNTSSKKLGKRRKTANKPNFFMSTPDEIITVMAEYMDSATMRNLIRTSKRLCFFHHEPNQIKVIIDKFDFCLDLETNKFTNSAQILSLY